MSTRGNPLLFDCPWPFESSYHLSSVIHMSSECLCSPIILLTCLILGLEFRKTSLWMWRNSCSRNFWHSIPMINLLYYLYMKPCRFLLTSLLSLIIEIIKNIFWNLWSKWCGSFSAALEMAIWIQSLEKTVLSLVRLCYPNHHPKPLLIPRLSRYMRNWDHGNFSKPLVFSVMGSTKASTGSSKGVPYRDLLTAQWQDCISNPEEKCDYVESSPIYFLCLYK